MKKQNSTKKTVRVDQKKILKEKREKIRQLRFDLNAGKLKNYKEIGKIKKEIAKILTDLNRK